MIDPLVGVIPQTGDEIERVKTAIQTSVEQAIKRGGSLKIAAVRAPYGRSVPYAKLAEHHSKEVKRLRLLGLRVDGRWNRAPLGPGPPTLLAGFSPWSRLPAPSVPSHSEPSTASLSTSPRPGAVV